MSIAMIDAATIAPQAFGMSYPALFISGNPMRVNTEAAAMDDPDDAPKPTQPKTVAMERLPGILPTHL